MQIEHLGMSGLRLRWAGASIAVDPPHPVSEPVVITWSEAERVAGARAAAPLAASPAILEWLGLGGVPLREGAWSELEGFALLPMAYAPIPYATPIEAARKLRSALQMPRLAARRLGFTLRRPPDPPLAIELRWGGARVVLLGQSLHRFLEPADHARLVEQFRGADLLIAGTDYDDEVATGRLLAPFQARVCVIADLVGSIRRELRLPMRPLSVALDAAPAGTLTLEPGDTLGGLHLFDEVTPA